MRRILALGALFGVLAVPTQAQDFTSRATLRSAGNPLNTPFFSWDVDRFGGAVDMMCIDERHYVHLNQTLSPGAFFNINTMPQPLLDELGFNLPALETVAGYYDYLAVNLPDMNANQRRSAQVAIWEVMGTRRLANQTHAGTSSSAFLNLYDGFVRPEGYDYFVMLQESDLAAIRAGDLGGITQPQFTRVSVPEPGMVLLLTSGLLILGFVGFRRRRYEA